MSAISSACKWISNVVRKAELLNVIGMTGDQNVQNENVQKLDILSNNIMISLLKSCGKTAVLVSEEDQDALFVKDSSKDGKVGSYCVVFDPLDGSSNIDCAVSIGTIFGIYKVLPGSSGTLKDVLRPGNEMVAAGYCMYGSSTVLVLTTGRDVNGYTLDPNIGEFILTHPTMKIGKKKIYSINEGNASTYDKAVNTFVHSMKHPTDSTKDFKPYSHRYVGSMVADVHRTLLYGGIFMYPTMSGSKLRILYECFPMAMLVEAAGGKATDGRKRILDLLPDDIHARSGIFLGSKSEVEQIEALYAKMDNGEL